MERAQGDRPMIRVRADISSLVSRMGWLMTPLTCINDMVYLQEKSYVEIPIRD